MAQCFAAWLDGRVVLVRPGPVGVLRSEFDPTVGVRPDLCKEADQGLVGDFCTRRVVLLRMLPLNSETMYVVELLTRLKSKT